MDRVSTDKQKEAQERIFVPRFSMVINKMIGSMYGA